MRDCWLFRDLVESTIVSCVIAWSEESVEREECKKVLYCKINLSVVLGHSGRLDCKTQNSALLLFFGLIRRFPPMWWLAATWKERRNLQPSIRLVWSFSQLPLGRTELLFSVVVYSRKTREREQQWERERKSENFLSLSLVREEKHKNISTEKFSSTFSFSFASTFLCESYGQVSCVCLVKREEQWRKKKSLKPNLTENSTFLSLNF